MYIFGRYFYSIEEINTQYHTYIFLQSVHEHLAINNLLLFIVSNSP